jgi:hypothetical protein
MMSDAERSLAKENGRAVFAVLDDQRLRTHGQHLVRRPRQISFAGEHLRFGIVDQQDVYEFQGFLEFFERAFDPVIHGVASGQAHTVHLAPHVCLQGRLNIRQKKELGVVILFRNARLECLEYVQVREVCLRLVQIVGIRAAPAERLAFGSLDAAGIDAVLAEDLFLLGTEIFADHSHDAHFCEITGCQGKIRGCPAQNIFHAPRRRGNVIKRN